MPNFERRRILSAAGAFLLVGGLTLQVAPSLAPVSARADASTIIVDYISDFAHLDSALCYDTQCYPWTHAMYDQLVGYDTSHGNGDTLVPDAAAAMPTLSNGNKTYTFKLRTDVHFWNGKLATSDDWVYSFERIIDPKTKSGGASFWFNIAGATAFMNGKATHVSGIKALGKFGLQITLNAPDTSFLNVLAMPFGSVVDKNQIAKMGKDYDAKGPMGTGPYMFKEHVLGQRLVLAKNPNYFMKGVGHAQTLFAQIGVTTDRSYLRVQSGQSDLDGDFPTPIPPAEFLSVLSDPVLKGRVVKQVQVATQYIAMNTKMKPFDNVLVRRAVNYAINKRRIVQLVNGRGVLTNNFLPPNMPGYQAFDLYPYDPAMARKLLAQAGFPNGFSTTFYSDNLSDDPRISAAIVQQLVQVGIKATLRVLDATTWQSLVTTPGKAPFTWTAWYQDFPDPNDFFEPILSCASAVPGTFNMSYYCNAKVDTFAQKLKGLSDQSTRLKQYPQLDRLMMADAPVAPVYNSVLFILPSKALKNFYLHNVWTLVLADYSKA